VVVGACVVVVVVGACVVVVVEAGVVVVVVEDGLQGFFLQEPVPMFVPPTLAQLSGVNCPHSTWPFSGMQHRTLDRGPLGTPVPRASRAAASVGTNATVASIASAATA